MGMGVDMCAGVEARISGRFLPWLSSTLVFEAGSSLTQLGCLALISKGPPAFIAPAPGLQLRRPGFLYACWGQSPAAMLMQEAPFPKL